jgi:DNA invertase Pin-like site-specific DNA recombinase
MITLSIALVWKLLLPLLVVVALLDWLTASDCRKVGLLRKQGLSQRATASRLGLSRHAVSKLCKVLQQERHVQYV